jgi:hypothetical protein
MSHRGRQSGLARRRATPVQLSVTVASQPALPPPKRARPEKLSSPEVRSASATKKPFGMLYDGATEADYINYMIARGAR